jgi:hypothetical protein
MKNIKISKINNMSNRSKAALYTLLIIGGCASFITIAAKYPTVVLNLIAIGAFVVACSGLYFSILESIELKEKFKK